MSSLRRAYRRHLCFTIARSVGVPNTWRRCGEACHANPEPARRRQRSMRPFATPRHALPTSRTAAFNSFHVNRGAPHLDWYVRLDQRLQQRVAA